jgi:hypothetical protein
MADLERFQSIRNRSRACAPDIQEGWISALKIKEEV